MDNSIEINGILFTLLCKSVADNLVYEIQKTRKYEYDRHREAGRLNIRNLRDIVKFTSRSIISRSSEDEKILYGYRSTSELGIWRLGYLEPKRCDLNKFSLDYVQGTLLHHLLQGLINNKFNELPFIPGDESGTNLLLDGAYNKTYFEENGLSENIRFLGFLDRDVQLQLMNHSNAIIQPSLFEGWSTVIEDAMAMNQAIIASDLEVNKEQLGESGIYFERLNFMELANILKDFKVVNNRYNYHQKLSEFAFQFYNILN
jgi:glycosyltransferase involved in cell wall biosynthesis